MFMKVGWTKAYIVISIKEVIELFLPNIQAIQFYKKSQSAAREEPTNGKSLEEKDLSQRTSKST